jgi:hypothetical protein
VFSSSTRKTAACLGFSHRFPRLRHKGQEYTKSTAWLGFNVAVWDSSHTVPACLETDREGRENNENDTVKVMAYIVWAQPTGWYNKDRQTETTAAQINVRYRHRIFSSSSSSLLLFSLQSFTQHLFLSSLLLFLLSSIAFSCIHSTRRNRENLPPLLSSWYPGEGSPHSLPRTQTACSMPARYTAWRVWIKGQHAGLLFLLTERLGK